MGGRTRIYQLLIFSSISILLLISFASSVVSVDASNDGNSDEIADDVKDADADKKAIRERLTKTFILLGEWEEYGIPPKTQPIKPTDQPEKPDAGVTPEEPPEKPYRERGYEVIVPPDKNGKAPIGGLSLPGERRTFIGASSVPLPPSGRGVAPAIYGIQPPTTAPLYFAVSAARAPLYAKPTVAISPVVVPSAIVKYPLYIPPAVSPIGGVTSPLITGDGGGMLMMGGAAVENMAAMAKQVLSKLGEIFNIAINDTYIRWTIVIIVFAAIIGKAAGWQVGMIGGAALGIALAMYSGPGGSLMPAFITGIIVLGSAAMISMAVSKMTAG